MGRLRRAVAGIAVAACLTGCGGTGGGATAPDRLDGQWQLTHGVLDGRDLVPDPLHPVTFLVDGGGVGGLSACNFYGADLSYPGDGVAFRMGFSTARGCQPAVMALEEDFGVALEQVEEAEVSDDALLLTGPGVRLELEPIPPLPTAALVGVTWRLESLVEGDVTAPDAAVSSVRGEPATLLLRDDGTFTGATGCRGLTGEWREHLARIHFTSMSARGRCPRKLQEQDGRVVAALGDGFWPIVEGRTLTIQGRDGGGLVYRAP